jgi:hypothetical protein
MSRWGRKKHDDTETALANFALTFAKALLVICVIMFVMISSDEKKQDGIRPKVEAVITVDWPKDLAIDVDTWMQTSDKRIVYFANKEAGVVFLDRDDLGRVCQISCEEIVSIRGFTQGEYILNLNVFYVPPEELQSDGMTLKKPLSVHVKIMKMNPVSQILFDKDITLHYVKEEKHVVRFTATSNDFINFDSDRPTMLQKKIGD